MKETNMEHFRSEIEENEYRYDFGVENGKLIVCTGFCYKCRCCDLSDEKNPNDGFSACTDRKLKWLMAEYKPTPVLTEREKHFVEFIQEGWLVRGKDEYVYWFSEEPTKESSVWWNGKGSLPLCDVGNGLFPFITWEDEEPWSVEELRKLEVKEVT